MSQFKKCKVVMLPTNQKTSTLWLTTDYQFIHTHVSGEYKEKYRPHHLYFLSNEEIKEGDWYYIPRTNSVHQCQNDPTELNLERHVGVRKVIATTDKSLTKTSFKVFSNLQSHQLPQPSQSFIEKWVEEFNKGNVIEEVMVEYERDEEIDGYGYDILKVNPKDNTITIRKIKDSWSKEEVIEFAEKYARMVQEKEIQLNAYKAIHNRKWIEQNL